METIQSDTVETSFVERESYYTIAEIFNQRRYAVQNIKPETFEDVIYRLILFEILQLNYHCIYMIGTSKFEEGDQYGSELVQLLAQSNDIHEFIGRFMDIVAMQNILRSISPIMRILSEVSENFRQQPPTEEYYKKLLEVFLIAFAKDYTTGRDEYSLTRYLAMQAKYQRTGWMTS